MLVEGAPKWQDTQGASVIVSIPASNGKNLRCPVTGDPTPDIIWLKDDKPVVDNSSFIVSTQCLSLQMLDIDQFFYQGFCDLINRNSTCLEELNSYSTFLLKSYLICDSRFMIKGKLLLALLRFKHFAL